MTSEHTKEHPAPCFPVSPIIVTPTYSTHLPFEDEYVPCSCLTSEEIKYNKLCCHMTLTKIVPTIPVSQFIISNEYDNPNVLEYD